MPLPERFLEDALDLAQRWSRDAERRNRRRRKHNRRRVRRVLRGVALGVALTFFVIPALFSFGLVLGPRGFLALLAAPGILVVGWVAIMRWSTRLPEAKPPLLLPSTDLGGLAQKTEDWIDEQRGFLPDSAQGTLDQLGQKLAQLGPQLSGLSLESPSGAELKRLVAEELPTLVQHYRKLPAALAQKPLYEGPSPEQKLLDGLAIIDAELARLHERLAREDLHALAAHQRYLELKYQRKDGDVS